MGMTASSHHLCPIPITELIDLDRYPVDRPDSPRYTAMVTGARATLADDGCAVIPQLLHSAALPIMSTEILGIRPFLHESRIHITQRRDAHAGHPVEISDDPPPTTVETGHPDAHVLVAAT